MKIYKIIFKITKIVLILFFTLNSFASLDTTFNLGDGYVQTSIHGSDIINKIKIQPDGKIIVVGFSMFSNNTMFALARYTTDGSLDTTDFNAAGDQPGIVLTAINDYSTAYNVDIQTDNKIVASGYTHDGSNGLFAIARYTTNGLLDTGFNSAGLQPGVVTTLVGNSSIANAVKIQLDGSIVTGGSAMFSVPHFALVRYTPIGDVDSTFNTSGTVTTLIGNGCQGHALEIQSDGKILLAGNSDSQFALARYTTAGALDTAHFNTEGTQAGTVVTPIGKSSNITALAIQADGKIVAAGSSDNQVALARYNSDGTLDTNYGTSGIVTTSIGSSSTVYNMQLQSDDKAVICGSTSLINQTHIFLARYNTDGNLDPSFGTDGIIISSIDRVSTANGLDIDSNGKFVIGGYTESSNPEFLVARFKEDENLVTITSLANNSTIRSSIVAIDGIYTGTNTTIEVYIDDLFSTTAIGAAGVWNAGNLPPVSQGFHIIRADLLNNANDVIDSYEVGFTIDLSQIGATGPIGADLTSNDFIFAYSTATQTVTAANIYQNVNFNNVGPSNGWTLLGNTDFITPNTGVYEIWYSGLIGSSAGTSSTTPGSFVVTVDGTGITGSQTGILINQNISGVSQKEITNKCIVNLTAGDVVNLKWTGSTTAFQLTPTGTTNAPGATRRSADIIITRIR